ncbi:hypothetical protein EJB05_53783, partial [Eragrostis curvula]
MSTGGGVLFSKYIDDNILTLLLSQLQVITDDERLRGSDLLDDLEDLWTVFAGMAENERSLVHLFDPIVRLVDDLLESVVAGRDAVDVALLLPKLSQVAKQIRAVNKAIAEYPSSSRIHPKGQPSSAGTQARGGGGGARESLAPAILERGAVVKKRLLIHWWMGEGFVESVGRGKERFEQLVGMRFLRAVRRGHCDAAHACTVHPWVRGVLVAVARDSAFLLDADNDITARRACMRDGGDASQAPLINKLLHPEARMVYNVDQKYVRLSDACLRGISRIKAVPDGIGRLAELLVLDLRACHNLQVLTREVTKLHRLQYLDVSECYLLVDMPEGLGKLSQLQVLKGFVLASSRNACSLRELPAITGLRKLTIAIGKKLKRAEAELAVLSRLTRLTSLKITWGMVSSSQDDGKEQSSVDDAPAAFALPSALSKLELCCFPCPQLTDLVKPDGLQILKKLYITGGKLRDLGPPRTDNGVEVLRLRCLKHLRCDWAQLHGLYAQL